jgi:hypothetical protein
VSVRGDPKDAGGARRRKPTGILLEKSYFSIAWCFFRRGLRFQGAFAASNDAAASSRRSRLLRRRQVRITSTLSGSRAFPETQSRRLSIEKWRTKLFLRFGVVQRCPTKDDFGDRTLADPVSQCRFGEHFRAQG